MLYSIKLFALFLGLTWGMPGDRYDTCVTNEGFTKGGHWRRVPGPVPGTRCYDTNATTTSWGWEALPEACQLNNFTQERLCSTFQAAGIRRVLFIGDSLSRNFRQQLNYFASAAHCDCDISHVHINHMAPPPLPPPSMAKTGIPGEDPLSLVTRSIEEYGPDLLVLNWGAHYSADYEHSSAVASYHNDSIAMARQVKSVLGSVARDTGRHPGLVIYRTTSHAHPGCARAREPFAGDMDTRVMWQRVQGTKALTTYKWDLFPEYNAAARKAWRAAFGAGDTELAFMDAAALTEMRPDLHMPRDPGSGRATGGDCLHYSKKACMNGAPPGARMVEEMGSWWCSLLESIVDAHTRRASARRFIP